MTKSASQRKAAPRKNAPQQPEASTGKKGGSGQPQSSKNKQSKAQPAVKQRTTLLTIALVLVSIGAVIDAIVPLLYRRTTYDITHPVVLGGAILVGLLGISGVVGLWLWKRWGLYLFVASVIGSIAVGLIIYPSMVAAFHALIPLLILGYGLAKDNAVAKFD
ncbi:MAG: hypothetical protein V9H69_05960 [Anaerolineae bacterium]|jgi:hypothetical protein